MSHSLDTYTWQTKNGTILLWKDMSVSHLQNCIHLLRRREEVILQTAICASLCTSHGEMEENRTKETKLWHGHLQDTGETKYMLRLTTKELTND